MLCGPQEVSHVSMGVHVWQPRPDVCAAVQASQLNNFCSCISVWWGFSQVSLAYVSVCWATTTYVDLQHNDASVSDAA